MVDLSTKKESNSLLFLTLSHCNFVFVSYNFKIFNIMSVFPEKNKFFVIGCASPFDNLEYFR